MQRFESTHGIVLAASSHNMMAKEYTSPFSSGNFSSNTSGALQASVPS